MRAMAILVLEIFDIRPKKVSFSFYLVTPVPLSLLRKIYPSVKNCNLNRFIRPLVVQVIRDEFIIDVKEMFLPFLVSIDPKMLCQFAGISAWSRR
jgi:hypothetical protein